MTTEPSFFSEEYKQAICSKIDDGQDDIVLYSIDEYWDGIENIGVIYNVLTNEYTFYATYTYVNGKHCCTDTKCLLEHCKDVDFDTTDEFEELYEYFVANGNVIPFIEEHINPFILK